MLVAVFFASDRSVHLMLGFSLFFTLAVMAFVAYDKPYRRPEDEEDAGGMGDGLFEPFVCI
eukprot:COSAG06_NODE_7980_length_2312_cov_10.301949_3_plen_61_part_00